MDWWALSNTSSIRWIHSAVLEILADKAFTATDGLISQSFVVAFVHPTYMRIALIWGFPAQLSLWKSVHWLWRYKLNEVCDTSQLDSLKFKSTTDAGIMLTHIIQSDWVKNKTTSILAFDIAQFFPSLNHHLLTLTLTKVGLNPKVTSFFEDFLVRRKTNYVWNKFSSPTYEVNVGVGQRSTLSPILSALYFSPLLYILEKHLNILNIPISLISFVDDSLFIS